MRNFLRTTAALEKTPRFYNTLFHNCTNELGKEAKIPWNFSFVLTGKSPDYLFRKGLIPCGSIAEARQRADMTAWLKAPGAGEKAAFDAMLLAELRSRDGLPAAAR